MRILKAALISTWMGAVLIACGQTGPLYLPQKPAPEAPTEQEQPEMNSEDADDTVT